MVELIMNQVHESERQTRHYGYLGRHLKRVNDALQFVGVIASCLAFFTFLGKLEAITLALLGCAAFTLTLSTLRGYAARSQKASRVSMEFAQLHFDWIELWNKSDDPEYDSFTEFKRLYARQLAIQELIPHDLTLSPWLARRAQNLPLDYWTPALLPTASSPSSGDPAQSL